MFKNRDLETLNKIKICKTHNDKNVTQNKIKLCILKSQSGIKTYHPLKNKRVKLHRLKFVCDQDVGTFLSQCDKEQVLFSKRFKVLSGTINQAWSTETKIIEWLRLNNIYVKRLPNGYYVINKKMYTINALLVFVNKKRAEQGLEPFFIEGFTEC